MISESPFSSYLNTNYVPSAVEADGIAALVEEQQEVACNIRVKMEYLLKEVQVLRGQYGQRVRYIQEHKAIISSIRRFPDSILIRIFLACRPHARFPAITISHVCGRWRQLALKTPLMWSEIVLDIHGFFSPTYLMNRTNLNKAVLGRVLAYLERSGTAELSVSVRMDNHRLDPFEMRQELQADLALVLLPTMHRWKRLEINVHDYSPLVRMLELPETGAVVLKSLTIDFKDANPLFGHGTKVAEATVCEVPSAEPKISVWAAETITSLTLLNIKRSIAETNVTLPVHWSALTTLRLHSRNDGCLQQAHVLPILAASVNLLEFSLTLFGPTNPQLPLESPIIGTTIPRLQTLELFGSEVPMRGLASKLTLPSLTNLTALFETRTPAPEGEATLAEWANRYGDQLLNVTFDYVSLTPAALLHCLSCLPNVVRLKMVGKSRDHQLLLPFPLPSEPSPALINNDVLLKLTPHFSDANSAGADGKNECFCPKLKQLECHMGYFERSEKGFIQLVRSRDWEGTQQEREGVHRIEEVVLDFHRKQDGSLDIIGGVHGETEALHPSVRVYYDAPAVPGEASSLLYPIPRVQAMRSPLNSVDTPRPAKQRDLPDMAT